jgi:hypothetical protein
VRGGRRAMLLLLPTATLPFRPARAQAGLEALMRAMAAVPQRQDRFSEDKVIPELDLPLPSTGVLRWQAPDRLEKHTTAPIEERLRVQGSRMAYERPDRGIAREFGLDEQPELRALVESIRATLAGDLPALRRHYDIRFEGAPDGDWRLVLTPFSLRVRAAVQRIRLGGRGAQILSVETEGGGGVTRMRITPAAGR